jgi:hypothetical protein
MWNLYAQMQCFVVFLDMFSLLFAKFCQHEERFLQQCVFFVLNHVAQVFETRGHTSSTKFRTVLTFGHASSGDNLDRAHPHRCHFQISNCKSFLMIRCLTFDICQNPPLRAWRGKMSRQIICPATRLGDRIAGVCSSNLPLASKIAMGNWVLDEKRLCQLLLVPGTGLKPVSKLTAQTYAKTASRRHAGRVTFQRLRCWSKGHCCDLAQFIWAYSNIWAN